MAARIWHFSESTTFPTTCSGCTSASPLEDKGPELAPTPLPDRIVIFRDNLCGMCESLDELIDEIHITVLHEIGHHFGLDEDRLEELGYE